MSISSKRPQETDFGYEMRVAEHVAELEASNKAMLDILGRIWRANDSKNNGAYMGEAVLCPMFAFLAKEAIDQAEKL